MTIDGKPAVFIAPAPRDDIGVSYVVIAEDFGQTRMAGVRLSREELLKVAEGLE